MHTRICDESSSSAAATTGYKPIYGLSRLHGNMSIFPLVDLRFFYRQHYFRCMCTNCSYWIFRPLIWWAVQIIRLLVTQFPSALRSEYFRINCRSCLTLNDARNWSRSVTMNQAVEAMFAGKFHTTRGFVCRHSGKSRRTPHDFRLQPRSSGKSLDVSGQPNGLMFNGQEPKKALKIWADKLSQNVGKDLPLFAA